MTAFYIILGSVIAAICASGWIYGLYQRGEAKGLRGDAALLGSKLAHEVQMHDATLERATALADRLEKAGRLTDDLESRVDYWKDRYESVQARRLSDVSGDDLRDLVNRMQLGLSDENEDRGETGGGGEVEDTNGDHGSPGPVSSISPDEAGSNRI